MAKKLPAVIGLLFMLLFGVAAVCYGEEDKVHLKADNISYDYENKMVTADGGIVITYGNLTIHASHVVIAVDENQMEADGDILVERGDEQYRGDHLSYDFKADKGTLQPLNMEMKTEGMKEPIFGRGVQAEIEGDNNIIHEGSFTTCNLEDPHYHFAAKELDYFPDDRLVFYSAVYYEGHVPLMYWPYLYISLKEEDSNFLMPVAGHDNTMGWFLILGYKFHFTDRWDGIAYFDWMSILGRRYRFQQTFEMSGNDKFVTEFAWLDNKQTDNNELSYTLELDKTFAQDWKLTVDYKWLQTTEYDVVSGYSVPTDTLLNNHYFMANLMKGSGNPAVRLNYNDTADSRYISLAPSISWQPFEQATLSVSGSWADYTYKTSDTSDSQTYGLNLRYTQKFTDHLNLNLNHQFTSSGKSATDVLALTAPQWDWGWFNQTQFTSDITYKLNHFTQYGDPELHYQTGYKLGLNLNATSVPIYQTEEKDFKVSLGWFLKERLYYNDYQSDDDEGFVNAEQFAAYGAVIADKKFNDRLSGQTSLKWTQTTTKVIKAFSGLTDTFNPGLGCNYSLTYNNMDARFNASFNGGFNFQNSLWEQQTISVGWSPNEESNLQFRMNYEPTWEDLSTTLSASYRPDEDTYIKVDYDYSTNGFTSLNVQTDIKRNLTDLWAVELHAQYNVFDQYVNSAKFSVSYDWHCRKVLFSYDFTREQYIFEVVFKAFPSAPVGLGDQSDFFWNWVSEVSK